MAVMNQSAGTPPVPDDIGSVPWDREQLREAIEPFARLYAERPIPDNAGGMQFNHCFAVWFVLRALQPPVVVESGVFKGQGTWLIEQACPDATIYSLDVNFGRLEWRSERAVYLENDLMKIDWTGRDLSGAVMVFDDHSNAYRRLQEMAWLGCRRAIFEDNFPVGEGDAYSLRQMYAGVGRTRIQVSARFRRALKEARYAVLQKMLESKRVRHNQSLLVEPNEADWANLARRLAVYQEIPPAWLPAEHGAWKVPWEGAYAARPPLLRDKPEHFDGDYGFVAYLELR
jgi:hypothetical protein